MDGSEICSKCGGKCCKHMPGIWSPSDIKPLTVGHVADMLRARQATVDWWEGPVLPDAPELCEFLRARARNDISWRVGSWGGKCVNLTATGCSLRFEDRPETCRGLVPGEPDCIMPDRLSKKNCAIAWLPYQYLLEEAVCELQTPAGE